MVEASLVAGAGNQPAAYIDFTRASPAYGVAPPMDDTGNPVAIATTSRPPKLVAGKLVADPVADTSYATYYQISLNGVNGRRIGCEFTVGAQDAGVTASCIALWSSVFTGGAVPQARAHVVIVPGTGQWQYGICDGAGHLPIVTTGFFAAPAYDGSAVWRYEALVDEDLGNTYLWLPDDSIVTITAAQIAATATATPGWAAGTTLRSLSGKYAMLEHFAGSAALTNVAAFPKFTTFWAEATIPSRASRRVDPFSVAKAISKAAVADASWTVPTLLGDWTAPTEPVGYRRLPNGLVELRGYLQGTAGTVAFTLPAGRRPPNAIYRPMVTNANTVVSFSIATNGDVTPNTYSAAGGWIQGIFDVTA